MKFKRNQVIITALVVMIAVAGYLNYTDNRAETAKNKMILDDNGEISALVPYDADTLMTDTGEIGDALTMEDSSLMLEPFDAEAVTTARSQSGTDSDMGEAVFVNTSNDSSYFVQAKLEREQSRAKQKDILMGLINDTNIDQDKRAVCADAMLEIQKRIEKETAAEAMIESKGFKEVYVRIDDSTVDVVVNKEVLTDAEIAQIEDIVKRKTGMDASQIRISAMKKS